MGARLADLVRDDRLVTCALVDLEVLYSARDVSDYQRTARRLRGFPELPISRRVTRRARRTQAALAQQSQHRVPITDLLIAACAQEAGAVVLHYDADFERIAEVTGQDHEWVVPRGSI